MSGSLFDDDDESAPVGWESQLARDARAHREAAAARDAGMEEVVEHADEVWKARLAAAFHGYLRSHAEFFVDDFWNDVDVEPGVSARALGPLVQQAARAGQLVRSGRYRPSTRSNLSEKPVWLSTIHEPSP